MKSEEEKDLDYRRGRFEDQHRRNCLEDEGKNWIDATKRKPPYEIPVWLYSPNQRVYCGTSSTGAYYNLEKHFEVYDVTHWCQMEKRPRPPKIQEN